MRLRTVGRRSGQERIAILAYFTDGPNLVTMAMNGWGDPEPAWWLNLQAQPDVVVELPDGIHKVHGRVATPPNALSSGLAGPSTTVPTWRDGQLAVRVRRQS
jgi:deazaflavin-dependent oxidoreductase (nitroreductase family)